MGRTDEGLALLRRAVETHGDDVATHLALSELPNFSALPQLLRLAKADVAAIKILAKPASQGGVQLNPAAESTMPYPEIPDARAYAKGGPAPELKADEEPTLASLFAAPHKSLAGRTYAQAVVDEIERVEPMVALRNS